jgi:hypothetical protein
MNQTLTYFEYVLLCWLVTELSCIFIGTGTVMYNVFKLPILKKKESTIADGEQFLKDVLAIIDNKMLMPHHKWMFKNCMEQSIQTEIDKMKREELKKQKPKDS